MSSAGARRGPHLLLVVGVRGSTNGGTAETLKSVGPYRTTRTLARTGAQVQSAHELLHTPTDTKRAAWCCVSRTASSRRRRNHLGKNLGRRVVGYGRRSVRRSATDPLTRLAPADEGAGCDPPSPPRGRGQRNSEMVRPTNVETPGLSSSEEEESPGASTFRMWFPLRPHHRPSPETRLGRLRPSGFVYVL